MIFTRSKLKVLVPKSNIATFCAFISSEFAANVLIELRNVIFDYFLFWHFPLKSIFKFIVLNNKTKKGVKVNEESVGQKRLKCH